MTHRFRTWALIIGMSCLPTFAIAEPDTSEDTTKAQAYLDLATTLFRKGDHQGALEELKRAQPLIEDAKVTALVHFNIARCYEELGMAIHALQAYRTYLGNGEEIPRRIRRAERFIERVKKQYMGDASIECSPENATVRLLEIKRAPKTCPARFSELPIGRYTLLVEADGHRTVRRPIEIVAAQVQSENITLVLGRDNEIHTTETTPSITEIETVSDDLYTSPSFLMTTGGGLALATGFVTHLVALQNKASIEDSAPGAQRAQKLEAYESQRTLTLISYGLGSALLGSGLYLMFKDELGLAQHLSLTPTGVMSTVQF